LRDKILKKEFNGIPPGVQINTKILKIKVKERPTTTMFDGNM
jgi:hypothetical protein